MSSISSRNDSLAVLLQEEIRRSHNSTGRREADPPLSVPCSLRTRNMRRAWRDLKKQTEVRMAASSSTAKQSTPKESHASA